MKISQVLQSIVVLVAVYLTTAEGLTLSLTHPETSIVRFTCKNGQNRADSATFQKNGVDIVDDESVIINDGGILELRLTPSQGLGGSFTCSENGIVSNTITLPGE